MGRQVCVEVQALLDAGCTMEVRDDISFNPEEDTYQWLAVTLPDGRLVGSDLVDCLCFDCRDPGRSANGWIEAWLVENQVPYVAG